MVKNPLNFRVDATLNGRLTAVARSCRTWRPWTKTSQDPLPTSGLTVASLPSPAGNENDFYRASSYASAVLGVVNLSVCPWHACFVTKSNNVLRTFWYHTNGQPLCFSDTNCGWRAMLPSVWNLHSKWPTPFETCRLWQISAYNVSTVRDSEKIQLWRIGSQRRVFNELWVACVSYP